MKNILKWCLGFGWVLLFNNIIEIKTEIAWVDYFGNFCLILIFWVIWFYIWDKVFLNLTPLQKSIKKYEKIVSILMLNRGKSYSFSEGDFSVDGKLLFKFGGSYCDLCKNYSCYRCPVYYKTNETMCCGTPYDKILEYRHNHPTGIITQKVIDLFIDELNFLRTLKEPNND